MKRRLCVVLLGAIFLIGGVAAPTAHADDPKAIDSEPILKGEKTKKGEKKIKKKIKKKPSKPKSIDPEPILKKK